MANASVEKLKALGLRHGEKAVVALAVGGLALEVRAARDGAQQSSAWDLASSGRGQR